LAKPPDSFQSASIGLKCPNSWNLIGLQANNHGPEKLSKT
jgi:hypothetical protein